MEQETLSFLLLKAISLGCFFSPVVVKCICPVFDLIVIDHVVNDERIVLVVNVIASVINELSISLIEGNENKKVKKIG